MDEWVVYRRVKIHPFLLRSISENNSIPPNYPCRPVARICGTSSVSIPFLFKVTYHIYGYMITPKETKPYGYAMAYAEWAMYSVL